MTSPSEIMKTWPLYRVAAQKSSTDDVQIRDVRCRDVMELHDLLKRIYSVQAVAELCFLEIHELLPQGKVAVVLESEKPWPHSAKQTKIAGIISPRIPREEDNKVEKAVDALASTASTVVAGNAVPDELGRPTISYKIEVA